MTAGDAYLRAKSLLAQMEAQDAARQGEKDTRGPQKVCTRCGQSKPLKSFPPRIRVRDGRASWCYVCKNGYDRERQQEKRQRSQPSSPASASGGGEEAG